MMDFMKKLFKSEKAVVPYVLLSFNMKDGWMTDIIAWQTYDYHANRVMQVLFTGMDGLLEYMKKDGHFTDIRKDGKYLDPYNHAEFYYLMKEIIRVGFKFKNPSNPTFVEQLFMAVKAFKPDLILLHPEDYERLKNPEDLSRSGYGAKFHTFMNVKLYITEGVEPGKFKLCKELGI